MGVLLSALKIGGLHGERSANIERTANRAVASGRQSSER
jgi:hypothetical protein